MRREELQKYKDKRIKVILKNGWHYSGKIQKVALDSFIFKDKFSELIQIMNTSVSVIVDIESNKRVYEGGGGR